jgi:site-specific recombinase XerD
MRTDLRPVDPFTPTLTSERDPDLAAIQAWLAEYRRKPNTLRAYAREARRFWLWWSGARHGRRLRELGRADIDDYMALLAKPPPAWLVVDLDTGWRPLQGPLTPEYRRQVLIILQSLFDYLLLLPSPPVDRNPLRTMRDKGPPPTRPRRRLVGGALLRRIADWLRAWAANLPADTEAGRQAARDVFIWEWIYWTAARRGDLARSTLRAIRSDSNGGVTRWWWDVVGKGEKQASIPLKAGAIAALTAFLGCTEADLADVLRKSPDAPLIPALRGTDRGVAASQVYASVTRVAKLLVEHAAELDLGPPEIEAIAAIRPHALRAHRSTHLFADRVDARHVQRLLRHADINTTLRYDHTAEEAFHDALG